VITGSKLSLGFKKGNAFLDLIIVAAFPDNLTKLLYGGYGIAVYPPSVGVLQCWKSIAEENPAVKTNDKSAVVTW